jgi:hypothetical protein
MFAFVLSGWRVWLVRGVRERLNSRSFAGSEVLRAMHEPFITAKMLITRAKHQIADLRDKINAFSDSHTWTRLVEKDVDGVTDIHKIRMPPNPSAEWTHIVFEATNNLRSALDQIAFNVAILDGKPNAKAAKFPFGPTEADMLNNLVGGCKDLPSEIQGLFRGFGPYKGGNNALWALNEIVNTKKHKLLIPVAMTSMRVQVPAIIRGDPFTIETFNIDGAKNEITFLKVAPGGQHLKYEVNITPVIAIDHSEQIIRGQHPIALLDAMTSEVERVGMATEVECRRIGLIT